MGENFSESTNKGITIGVIPEDLSPLYSANHNVVESAWGINASFSRHE